MVVEAERVEAGSVAATGTGTEVDLAVAPVGGWGGLEVAAACWEAVGGTVMAGEEVEREDWAFQLAGRPASLRARSQNRHRALDSVGSHGTACTPR